MQSHAEKSKTFFNNTDNYIRSNVIITFRKLLVNKLLGKIKEKKIIDIGCGNGELTFEYLNDNYVTFFDVSEKMLDIVKSKTPSSLKNKATYINDDIISYSFKDKFEIIICIGVVAHVSNIEELLLKLTKLIDDDGILLLQYSDNRKLISKLNRFKAWLFKTDKYNYKINHTSSFEIEKSLTSLGFRISAKEPYFPVSPFFLPFNEKNRLNLVMLSNRNRFLRFFGSEIILKIKKQK